MPEGITYYDMKRMMAAQVPSGTYKLELHPRWFRADSRTLVNAELLNNILGRSFQFSGKDVEHWGKALGIPLCDGIWLRVQFALHGHGLPATTEEYRSMVEAWDSKDSKVEFSTFICAAIVGEEMSIILVDRNRLMTITVIDTLGGTIPWFDQTLAPCPMREPDLFEKNIDKFYHAFFSPSRRTTIYKSMTDSFKNNVWNGIGTSHAVEILHLARIHPETPTPEIFNDPTKKSRLLTAIRTFFLIAQSPEYIQRVPAGKTSKNAFEFSPSVTRYYNEQFTKVYRKGSTLVSLEVYDELQRAGLLAPGAKELEPGWKTMRTKGLREKRKRLPVYTIQMTAGIREPKVEDNPTSTHMDDAIEAPSNGDTSTKPNTSKKRGQRYKRGGKNTYTYTCIYKQPEGAKGVVLENEVSEKKKKRLREDGNIAEIGIASFMDTIREIRKRKLDTKKTAHRVSIKEGKVGRPIKRKRTEKEMSAMRLRQT